MKVLSLLLALVNSLLSGLILLSCISLKNLHLEARMRLSGRLGTALLVIVIGILTFRDGVRPLRPGYLLLAGLLLVLLGTSSIMWGIHLSLVTGDLKNVMIFYGGSLVIQGTVLIWGLSERALTATE